MSGASLHIVCPHCLAVNRIPPDRPSREANCGKCHYRLFSGKPVDANAQAFDRYIERNDIPVVVDFWAPWCGPCKAMAPGFERAAAELEPRVRLLKVNADEAPSIAARYGVQSIPTMLMFAHGKLVAQHVGAMGGRGVTTWIQQHQQDM